MSGPLLTPHVFHSELKERTGMELITYAVPDDNFPIPKGLTDMGPVTPKEYDILLVSTYVRFTLHYAIF